MFRGVRQAVSPAAKSAVPTASYLPDIFHVYHAANWNC